MSQLCRKINGGVTKNIQIICVLGGENVLSTKEAEFNM